MESESSRPSEPAWTLTLAGPQEPGTRLVVRGVVEVKSLEDGSEIVALEIVLRGE